MADTNSKTKHTRWRLRVGERRVLLTIGDLFMSFIALALAIMLWAQAERMDWDFFLFIQERLQGWFFLLPFIWLILLVESYEFRTSSDLRRTFRSVAISTAIGIVLYMAVYFTSDTSLPRRGVAAFLGFAALLTLLWRMLYIRVFTAPGFSHRVLLVGAGETGHALLSVVKDMSPAPFNLVGLIDDDSEKIGKEIMGYKVLGGSECLIETIEREDISDLIVAISGRMMPTTFQILLEAQERGIQITRMPVAYEELMDRVPVQYLEADWMLRSFVDETRVGAFYELGKRIMDIIGGLVGVFVLMFIGPLISLAILLESGRPIVYEQTRAGKGGIPFRILKFRTMKKDAESDGSPQLTTKNDERITTLGRFLRKTHLDEWLQFINVLRGEMSLVGPRPERPELVNRFQEKIPFYRARLLVKPGIAGWAQVNVSYFATIEEMVVKLEYDLYYIKHRNILIDIIILLRTFAAIFGFRGR